MVEEEEPEHQRGLEQRGEQAQRPGGVLDLVYSLLQHVVTQRKAQESHLLSHHPSHGWGTGKSKDQRYYSLIQIGIQNCVYSFGP